METRMETKLRTSTPGRFLDAPNTCWRIEPARRAAFIVDAEHYYRVVREALELAQRSVFLIGWDFNHRIRLQPGDSQNLGKLLASLVARKPRLRIHVLSWNSPIAFEVRRWAIPFRLLNAISNSRLRYRLDSSCPKGACHHQKIVLIDDTLAFCGGMDLTDSRWDTRAHADDEPGRRELGGMPYEPYHDMMLAVDGDAASALAELAHERWRRATGKSAPAVATDGGCWPKSLQIDIEQVPIGIARTEPTCGGRPEVREVEALYLAAIAGARRHIYIENQYFASRRVFEALAERLSEADGPEIVVINPKAYSGRIEQLTMGELRTRVVCRLRRADTRGRFGIYAPETAKAKPITVHAKTLVVDDLFVRIGSANLSNRSMGFDSECDLAIEADSARDPERAKAAIVAYRNGLLAEHLGAQIDQVSASIEAEGSLIRTIDRLSGLGGRRLAPVDLGADADDGEPIVSVMDPESVDAALSGLRSANSSRKKAAY